MRRGQQHQHDQATSLRADRADLFGGPSSTTTSQQQPSLLLGASFARSRQAANASIRPGINSTSNSSNNNATTAMEAAGIQRSLERTQALLRHELERVSHVASTIDHDGKLLNETTNLHQQMNVKGAKKALTSLERAQQRHRRVLNCSLVFFWTVVFYIAWERVLTRLPFVDRILQTVLRGLF